MTDWLDEQGFYEVCQTYRWAEQLQMRPGQPRAAEAFEALKDYIRNQIDLDRDQIVRDYGH